ncbi:MAG: hypothetical protein ABFC96_04175 [Thermoguttaceae bacterium]
MPTTSSVFDHRVTSGVDAISIYYRAVVGKIAIETFFLNKAGFVYKAIATYN